MYLYRLIGGGYEVYHTNDEVLFLRINGDTIPTNYERRYVQKDTYAKLYSQSIENSAIVHCTKLNEKEKKYKAYMDSPDRPMTLVEKFETSANATVQYLMNLASTEGKIQVDKLPQMVQHMLTTGNYLLSKEV